MAVSTVVAKLRMERLQPSAVIEDHVWLDSGSRSKGRHPRYQLRNPIRVEPNVGVGSGGESVVPALCRRLPSLCRPPGAVHREGQDDCYCSACGTNRCSQRCPVAVSWGAEFLLFGLAGVVPSAGCQPRPWCLLLVVLGLVLIAVGRSGPFMTRACDSCWRPCGTRR